MDTPMTPDSAAASAGGRAAGARGVADTVDLISRVERAIRLRLAVVLREHGCTVERWRALALLADGEDHPMSELIAHALLAPSTATRMVDGLVADELASRVVGGRDRRRVSVYATARGLEVHRCLSAAVERAARDILPAALDDDALAGLRVLLVADEP